MENKSTFTKVSRTDDCLYGPRKLLICGFPFDERHEFLNILKMTEIKEIPTIWVGLEKADNTLQDLFMLSDMWGVKTESKLLRAVIMGGITNKELHGIMGSYRNSGLPSTLWAVLTPTSEKWTLKMLLKELDAERCKMRKKSVSES